MHRVYLYVLLQPGWPRSFTNKGSSADTENDEESYWQRMKESASRFNYLPRRKVACPSYLFTFLFFFFFFSVEDLSTRTYTPDRKRFVCFQRSTWTGRIRKLMNSPHEEMPFESTTWSNVDVVIFKGELTEKEKESNVDSRKNNSIIVEWKLMKLINGYERIESNRIGLEI